MMYHQHVCLLADVRLYDVPSQNGMQCSLGYDATKQGKELFVMEEYATRPLMGLLYNNNNNTSTPQHLNTKSTIQQFNKQASITWSGHNLLRLCLLVSRCNHNNKNQMRKINEHSILQ